jgi:probable phosphoglycerate mutase
MQGSSPEAPHPAPEDDPATTRLVIVRHGETVWNCEARIQGQLDPDLSVRGREQAEELALRLRQEPVAAIYSSSLSRARETAAIIASELGLTVREDPGFRESCFGSWEGLTTSEIRARFPEEYRLWRQDSVANRPPGGETVEALQQRVMASVREILTTHPGESVMIVTHAGPVRCLVCGLVEIPLHVYPRLRVDNASVSRVWVGPRGAILVDFNETAGRQP